MSFDAPDYEACTRLRNIEADFQASDTFRIVASETAVGVWLALVLVGPADKEPYDEEGALANGWRIYLSEDITNQVQAIQSATVAASENLMQHHERLKQFPALWRPGEGER